MPLGLGFDLGEWLPHPAVIVVYVLAFFALLVFVAAIAGARTGTCRAFVRQNPALLLPTLLAFNLLVLLGRLIAPLNAVFFKSSLGGFLVSLNAYLILSLLLMPAAITLLLAMTHARLHGRACAPAELASGWKRLSPRVLLAHLLFTWGPILALIPLFLLGAVLGPLMLAVIAAMGVACVLLNALTCTLYAALGEQVAGEAGSVETPVRVSLLSALGTAARFARTHKAKLAPPLAVQLLLSGFLIFYVLTVTRRTRSVPQLPAVQAPSGNTLGASSGFPSSLQTNIHHKQNFKINVLWVLAVDSSCRWYSEVRAGAEESSSPLAGLLLGNLMVLLGTFFVIKYSHLFVKTVRDTEVLIPRDRQ
jgi:hypothetical protein